MTEEFPSYVNSHEELLPVIETAVRRRAWVIVTYHAVAIPEGWGHHPLEEYEADLDAIRAADLWSANLDMVAACIR